MPTASNARNVAIALLRNDLRLHDNAVFSHVHFAPASAFPNNAKPTHLLPLYVFDERQIECGGVPGFHGRFKGKAKTGLCGFWRTGPYKLRFITDSVFDLKSGLRAAGSDLLIRCGLIEDVAAALVKALTEQGCTISGVFLQKEICTEEVETERRLDKKMQAYNVPVTYFRSKPLVHPDDLPFPVSKTPDVFTPFRKRIEGLRTIYRPCSPVPSTFLPFPDSVPHLDAYGAQLADASLDQTFAYLAKPLGGGPDFGKSNHQTAFPYRGGESEGLRRLEDYFSGHQPPVAHYKTTRNGLLGANYSTKMSPFLAFGCVSPRRMMEGLAAHEEKHGATKDTYWVLFEMLWRDFFIFTSEKFGSHVFALRGLEGITNPKAADKREREWKWWSEGKRVPPDLQAWFDARTGVPFLDANLIELQETGFMSNRGRQNVASFLAKDLGYDWRIGAEFFEANLLDYDPASNYCNWAYIAGVGNDPRASRQFNAIKQAKDYDSVGEYVKTWIPQLKRLPTTRVHTPWLLTDRERAGYDLSDADYPARPILEQQSWKHHYEKAPPRARGAKPQPGQRNAGPGGGREANGGGGGGGSRGRGKGNGRAVRQRLS